MMYCEGANIPIQSGAPSSGGTASYCNIFVNGANNPIHMNGGGYGLYMRFDCGNGIETRMAHLQGYSANSRTVINGRTGNAWTTPPHVHYEIYVDGKAVDPECALGVPDPKNKCPTELPPGPANLCDKRPGGVVSILHADAQRKLGSTSAGTSMRGGTSVSPDTFPSGVYGNPCDFTYKGVKQCSDPNKQCEKIEVVDNKPIDPKTGLEIDMGDEGEWDLGGDTLDYTGIRPGTGDDGTPGVPGRPGPPGRPGGPPRIPPLDDATPGDASSCAVDTWVALSNQSALEAQRETMLNRRFVAKADSVLDYGCLPIYLKKTENEVAYIFSETDRWVNKSVDIKGKTVIMNKTLGTSSMDTALVNVVWQAHQVYKQEFNHPLMGGLEGYSETANAEQCKDMYKVWQAAKCQNFPAGDEVFVQFADLINPSSDLRKFPTMDCTRTGITQNMIDAANNKATKYDKVIPRFDFLKGDGDCKPPIPSGVTIYRHEITPSTGYVANISTYPDAVCSNAGCYYDNPTMSGAGECKKD